MKTIISIVAVLFTLIIAGCGDKVDKKDYDAMKAQVAEANKAATEARQAAWEASEPANSIGHKHVLKLLDAAGEAAKSGTDCKFPLKTKVDFGKHGVIEETIDVEIGPHMTKEVEAKMQDAAFAHQDKADTARSTREKEASDTAYARKVAEAQAMWAREDKVKEYDLKHPKPEKKTTIRGKNFKGVTDKEGRTNYTYDEVTEEK